MKFKIDELDVYFPYAYIYPEQYNYMVALKKALDAGGPCMLEMPSGTGKTVSLLSLISSYQVVHPTAKLIYCSRTVPEIEQAMEEARRVLTYRNAELGESAPKTLALAMTSRLIFSYQYMLDPKISSLVSSQFASNSIVVFDEAHNIDNVCINALSINIDNQTIENATKNLTKINNGIENLKKVDAERLKNEYVKLVQGLARSGDTMSADPLLPNEVINEVVPGNIRKAEHFVSVLRRFIDYLRSRLRTQMVVSESPLSFLRSLSQLTTISAKTLRFCSSRLSSLLRTLQISDLNQFSSISVIADFATLVGTYGNGFIIIIEPYDQKTPNQYDPIFQFCCLDASIGMKPIFDKYKSVIITSGTLSPIDIYQKILNFRPSLVEQLSMSLHRSCICPCILTRGSDQISVSTKFDVRADTAVIRNYGALLVEMSAIVPDGIICFFTSYSYMEQIVSVWNEMGLLNNILNNKLIFVETSDAAESALALQNYKKACDSGRGAVLLSVARGKVSEGIDFDNQYGRCVILYGIPYINTESRVLRARLEYQRDKYQIKENEFLTFDAMRTASQCVGRVIRGKSDYGIMIFADKRYNRLDKRNKLPQWILQFCQPQHLNLSTDMAVALSRAFLKDMAQPYSREEQLGKSLWNLQNLEKHQEKIANTTNTTSPTTLLLGNGHANGNGNGNLNGTTTTTTNTQLPK
ncbi:transcription factor IIH component [Heterostelium album PN500]|uniref:DNA 5'-3' helicase n=1 Tax=Heterostelium pallidum (strain ATCC 26659 / Pp 5 / PN500) TaxID=670386 RepID=D3BKQ8_HETP5|nr:transcription factor IIH component [Heterostelium album PN500]EFA78488.1 transcription factor IIH component [Heterostelium album PN500]|eukprot:XP_020430612.1 transcription factor IIH component [Heterostelium album PN500]